MLIFTLTYTLTCDMEDLSRFCLYVGLASMFILCLGSELATKLALGELDFMLLSF
jgi:hypothetical protein